jgi:hypothetical protein
MTFFSETEKVKAKSNIILIIFFILMLLLYRLYSDDSTYW